MNTAAIFGFHQKVVVDTPSGPYGQSFGLSSRALPQQGFLEALGQKPQKGGVGAGVVYEDDDAWTTVNRRFRTQAGEDTKVYQYLKELEGNVGPYNVAFYNCRDYSRAQYETIIINVLANRKAGAR